MALQFATAPAFNAAGNPYATTQADRPKAQVWLNVGTTVEIPNPETGEVEEVFVALPVGIPLDTMEAMEVRGSNKNWANMVQAKNWLLDQLQALGGNVKPGEEQLVDGLQIQVKRVGKPQTATDEGDNPFLSAMQGRLSVVK